MKILITGTHFTPAVATIQQLKKYPQVQITYVGRKTTLEGDNTKSAESQILPSLGVKFIPLIAGRLQRSFTPYTIPSLLKIPIGFIQSLFILLKEKPDVILSFGGYVSVPLVIWGWLFSIPIIVHEQGLIPGLSNKISFLLADKIALSFPQSKSFNQEKTILTGNPLRKEIINILNDRKNISSNKPQILVVGGNQGSHVINLAVEEILDKLTKIAAVFHQTGDSKFGDFQRLKLKENKNYQVEKFIDKEWAEILKKSDLIITRAGINTLTEITFLGKPALVIPIPHHKEQQTNAKYFENLGVVKILPQNKLTGELLFNEIKTMLKKLGDYKKKTSQTLVKVDAAQRLALETILLVNHTVEHDKKS